MHVVPLPIPEVLRITPRVFSDSRGCFYESFNLRDFQTLSGTDYQFVQDNHSISHYGVVRGLHYQRAPRAQGKLVRVLAGEIFDVAVDIRRHSPTLGQWVAERLSADNRQQLWIPPGFAHGFMVLSDRAEVLYKTTEYWEPAQESSICWDDRTLQIEWPTLTVPPQLSPKDQQAPSLKGAELFD